MPFGNTEVTSKQCNTLIFFRHTLGIIYHFQDNYASKMFFTKVINPFLYMPEKSQNTCIPLPSSNVRSSSLSTKQIFSRQFLATRIPQSSATCSVFCVSQAQSCKWLCLSTRKSRASGRCRCVEPNMTLQSPGIVVNNLEPS